eukprot:TRINITY_DN4792_c0_g1_i1.p1 TRINITY_DN4792_c0_g1~~TRINITY_DN4792_c0_g1_i1.p1  ORF type:complete len:146 (+),score=7.68 TRINITY_DN4792_c0_g1_i1:50-487(+)
MINTIITYQYGLYYKQIKIDSPDISELLQYLHPKKEQGPKALWKLDAFYFSKIDNMLALLIAPVGCQRLFREWNPKFIFDDLDTHTSVLTQQINSVQISQSALKSDVSSSYRLQITHRLNKMSKMNNFNNVRTLLKQKRKSTELA